MQGAGLPDNAGYFHAAYVVAAVVYLGYTALLVPFAAEGGASPEPRDPDAFQHALADAVNALLADPARREAMGRAARERVLASFSWRAIAARTLEFYRDLVGRA